MYHLSASRNGVVFKLDDNGTTNSLTITVVNFGLNLLDRGVLGNAMVVVFATYTADSVMARQTTHHVTLGRGRRRRGSLGVAAIRAHPFRHVLVSVDGPTAVPSLVRLDDVVGAPHRNGALCTLDGVGNGVSTTGGLVDSTVAGTRSVGSSVIPVFGSGVGMAGNVVRTVRRGTIASMVIKVRTGTGFVSAFFKPVVAGLIGTATRRAFFVCDPGHPIDRAEGLCITIPSGTRRRGNFRC